MEINNLLYLAQNSPSFIISNFIAIIVYIVGTLFFWLTGELTLNMFEIGNFSDIFLL